MRGKCRACGKRRCRKVAAKIKYGYRGGGTTSYKLVCRGCGAIRGTKKERFRAAR